MRRPGNAELARDVLAHLPDGYTFGFPRQRRSPHPVLYDPNGEVVRSPDGRPLTIACSPSDTRVLKKALGQLRRAGLPVSR